MNSVLHAEDCECGLCADARHEQAVIARTAMDTANRIATWLRAERAVRQLAGDLPMTGPEEIDAIRAGRWVRS